MEQNSNSNRSGSSKTNLISNLQPGSGERPRPNLRTSFPLAYPARICLRHDKCTSHFSPVCAMGYIVRYGARLGWFPRRRPLTFCTANLLFSGLDVGSPATNFNLLVRPSLVEQCTFRNRALFRG